MPNRRSRPFSYRPNTNPHNPTERFVRPNGKRYAPRSAPKVVRYENRIVVFRTFKTDTALRLIDLHREFDDLKLSEPEKMWVKEYMGQDGDGYVIEFDRPENGAPALVFEVCDEAE